MLVAIVLARPLDDLVVGEGARRLADQALLVSEFEVHGRGTLSDATLPGLMAPETRYARSGELHIAYQVVGEGPIDLV